MKNYLFHTFLLTILVMLMLSGLNLLPPLQLSGRSLRAIDLLSDIRMRVPVADTLPIVNPDTLLPVPFIKPAFIDTCRTGLTCIEDYSDSTRRGMTSYYQALDREIREKRPVRIAVFGDSFIEGDIFTSDLREMLQKQYGGCGVGFVPVTSAISSYRPTVRHRFEGWRSYSATDTLSFHKRRQGISGDYFVPYKEAWLELSGVSYLSCLDSCQSATLYFMTDTVCEIKARINRGGEIVENYYPSPYLQQMNLEGTIRTIRWEVPGNNSLRFFGAAMDGKNGVVLDNFSLRGGSGGSLRTISAEMLKEFNRVRPYDLIILQYGLNVATEWGYDYNYYKNTMKHTIRHLKECFPQAGFLLLSVGDRNYRNEEGELATMPGVKNLIRYQQAIAAENRIAFWNMFEAMGGEGSIADMVHATPSLANYDYTHINFKGGKHLAKILYETLLYGKEQYDKRREYETD
ncbi:MAG: SGNH/GDSL hydrolase family protein [Bacteroides sp.]|nr:SGNH/GDSL hydrolase family protein [Bacteroides sp.]